MGMWILYLSTCTFLSVSLNGVSMFSTFIWLCLHICPLPPFFSFSFVFLLTLSVPLYSCICLVPLSQKAPFWLAALFATKMNFNTCPWLAPLKIHYSLSSLYMPAQFYHFRNIHGLFKEKLHTVLALSVIGKMEQHSQDFNEFCNIADIFAPERQTLSASFLCQSS